MDAQLFIEGLVGRYSRKKEIRTDRDQLGVQYTTFLLLPFC